MSYFAPPRPRAVLAITGDEATDFLQGLLTNDLNALAPAQAQYTALLSPQGKLLHAFLVYARPGGGYWLDICADGTADLMRRLRMFRLRAKVGIEDVSAAFMVALGTDDQGVEDPRAPDMDMDMDMGLGTRTILPKQDLPPAPAAYEQRRIALGIPDQGVDFAPEELFPTDVNMDVQNGIAFKKGCYIGQEVVSRMKRRGTIRKRICMAQFDGPSPAYGSAIMAGPARLGDVRSNIDGQALVLVRTDKLAAAMAAKTPIIAGDTALNITAPLLTQAKP